MADELVHLFRQAAQQGVLEYRPHIYGHIASYDPLKHRVRCIVPSLTDEDGTPLLTPWMPMGTLSAGDGYGIQVVYKGGANADNPTAGEQVEISLYDRVRGVAAATSVFHHATTPPPATNLPKKDDGYPDDAAAIAGGDVIISTDSPTKGAANTFMRFRANGDLEVWGCTVLNANILGDINATTVNGNINATASKGDVSVLASLGNISVTAAVGSVDMLSPIKITLDTPIVEITGVIDVTNTRGTGGAVATINGLVNAVGNVVAGVGTGDQVTLQQHRHGVSGSSASSTVPPSPGT